MRWQVMQLLFTILKKPDPIRSCRIVVGLSLSALS